MKYRKKPVVIEAVQLGSDNLHEIERFAGDDLTITELGQPIIHTMEGGMHVSLGDWIIKGVNGEHYPCKPDIFEKTYEPA